MPAAARAPISSISATNFSDWMNSAAAKGMLETWTATLSREWKHPPKGAQRFRRYEEDGEDAREILKVDIFMAAVFGKKGEFHQENYIDGFAMKYDGIPTPEDKVRLIGCIDEANARAWLLDVELVEE